MVRPALTGLATAYFRLFVLVALGGGPARPASLLASASADGLPLANGAFGRALQSLVEGGHVAPTVEGAVGLTPAGAAERLAERVRWAAVIASASRLLGDSVEVPAAQDARRPEPDRPAAPWGTGPDRPAAPRGTAPADAYLDRVLVATLRERIAAARDGGPGFALAIAEIDVSHPAEAARRALVHRVVRALLAGAATLIGPDVAAYRYGDRGIALLIEASARPARGANVAAAMGQRVDELLRSTSSSVRAFNGARWRVRTGFVDWSAEVPTTLALLRLVQGSLAGDEERSVA